MKLRRVAAVVVLLPAAAYVIWDQVESRALAREIAAIAQRGAPITVADAAPIGADTPERHDAARIYAAAAQRVRALPPELTVRLSTLDLDRTAAPPLDLAELERTYPPDTPALQLLDQGTPLDFNGFGDVEFDENNSPLLTLNQLAAMRADLFSARGRGDAAAQALIPCVRLRRTMPLTQQTQVAIRLLGSVRIMLHHAKPSERSLEALQRALMEPPDSDDLVHYVEQQRARFIDEINSPRGEVGDMILRRLLRPWMARANRRNLDTYREAIDVSRRPWPEKFIIGTMLQEKYGQVFRGAGRPGFGQRMMRNSLFPYGIGIIAAPFTQAGIELAARRVIVAVLAVERYRRQHGEVSPSSLASLVPAYLPALPNDPFSAQPLVYRTGADHYLLYSVDVNRTDDAGALYGFGSGGQRQPRPGAGRDLGIRVEMH